MIIIEGMDNSGKTKLAESLSYKFNLEVMKRSGPPKNREAFILDTLELLTLDPEVIYDRHPIISEGVYGPVLRDTNVFESEGTHWEFYMDRLIKNNPLLIYCRPPDTKILSFGSREQMEGVREKARRLIDRYDILMNTISKRGLLIHKYDFTSLCATIMAEYVVASYLTIKRRIEGYEYK